MRAKTLIFFMCLLLSKAAFAQDIPFDSTYFKDNLPQFAQALKNLATGNTFFAAGEHSFRIAIPYFNAAHAFNPANALLNYKLGRCYLVTSEKFKAYDFFRTAFELNPNVCPDIHLQLGNALHVQSRWDEAIEEFSVYKKSVPAGSPSAYESEKKISECLTGKELTANPARVLIENLGENINTKFAEYSPLISPDESVLIFTARRNDTYGSRSDPNDNIFFEDVYISHLKDGLWQKAQNIGSPVNSFTHDAGSGLSPDGHSLFVFKGGRKGGDIFVSRLEKGNWTKPSSLGKNINSADHESSACLSFDGSTLYFISDRLGGYGRRDIWYSKWDRGKNKWGMAVNAGAKINTRYDEEGVFIHPDGRTIFFSSKGHQTMGGYDIFKSVLVNDSWSKPENLGSPINTPDDDVFFTVGASGLHGYYASFRKEGLGEKDIYRITFLDTAEAVAKLALITGTVKNIRTGDPMEAIIEIYNLEKDELIGKFRSNAKTGKFVLTLPSGRNYSAVINTEGYLFESENYDIADTATYTEYKMDVLLKPVAPGYTVRLSNIFFDFNKDELKPESKNELHRLVSVMKEYPKISIEITGHTDNVGSEEYNQELSELRAKAVYDFLLNEGVQASRLSYTGFGEKKPVASNDDNQGRKMNRRIEFKVVE